MSVDISSFASDLEQVLAHLGSAHRPELMGTQNGPRRVSILVRELTAFLMFQGIADGDTYEVVLLATTALLAQYGIDGNHRDLSDTIETAVLSLLLAQRGSEINEAYQRLVVELGKLYRWPPD